TAYWLSFPLGKFWTLIKRNVPGGALTLGTPGTSRLGSSKFKIRRKQRTRALPVKSVVSYQNTHKQKTSSAKPTSNSGHMQTSSKQFGGDGLVLESLRAPEKLRSSIQITSEHIPFLTHAQ